MISNLALLLVGFGVTARQVKGLTFTVLSVAGGEVLLNVLRCQLTY